MGTVAGVAATVRRQCGEARGGLEDCQPLAARNERHQAVCIALRAFARSIDDVALRSRWPPIPYTGQAVIVALRRAQRPVWAPECESWADRPLFAGDRALRRSSIAPRSRGSGGVAQTERRRSPHPESSGRQVAGDDAQRRQHRGAEPALTARTDQVLREVVGVGGLRPLHRQPAA